MIFLVSCTIETRQYMQSGYEEFERIMVVDCDNEDQAELLAVASWEDRSEYNSGSSCSAWVNYISPLVTWSNL